MNFLNFICPLCKCVRTYIHLRTNLRPRQDKDFGFEDFLFFSEEIITWISFTVVAILALSAIGVGMGSARILPEDLYFLLPFLLSLLQLL